MTQDDLKMNAMTQEIMNLINDAIFYDDGYKRNRDNPMQNTHAAVEAGFSASMRNACCDLLRGLGVDVPKPIHDQPDALSDALAVLAARYARALMTPAEIDAELAQIAADRERNHARNMTPESEGLAEGKRT